MQENIVKTEEQVRLEAIAILTGEPIGAKPKAAEKYPYYKLSTQDLLTNAEAARDAGKAAFAEAQDMTTEIKRRMLMDKAELLFHPDFDKIALEKTFEREMRVDVLRRLIDFAKAKKADPAIVSKAIYLHTSDPVWKTNKTYLNQLHKLGGEIAKTIDEGVIERHNGYDLVIVRKKH